MQTLGNMIQVMHTHTQAVRTLSSDTLPIAPSCPGPIQNRGASKAVCGSQPHKIIARNTCASMNNKNVMRRIFFDLHMPLRLHKPSHDTHGSEKLAILGYKPKEIVLLFLTFFLILKGDPGIPWDNCVVRTLLRSNAVWVAFFQIEVCTSVSTNSDYQDIQKAIC